MTQNMCRFCFGQSDLKVVDTGLSFKIHVLLNIKIQEDSKRTSVCGDCRYKIIDFYDFRSLCNRAEEKFGNKSNEKAVVDGLIKIKSEPCDEDVSVVNVKKEPTDCYQMPSNVLPIASVGSNGLMYPPNGLVYPPFYAVDHTGKLVQMPAMVPLGSPIPISSLQSSVGSHMPCVGSLPLAMKAPSSLKEISSTTSDADSPSDNKIVNKSLRKEIKKEMIQTEERVLEPSTTQNDESESSDELNTVDDIINEVHTDNEDENSKSSSGGKVENAERPSQKMNEEEEKRKPESDHDLSQESHEALDESKDLTPNSDSNAIKDTPLFKKTRRGIKRRGASLPLSSMKKRLRNRSIDSTPKTPKGDKTESSPPKRLTRSSTGAKPRQIRKIVDSDSDDGDFNPDDPDDPDDPAYSINRKEQSSSSSSSDSETDSESKNHKENTTHTKDSGENKKSEEKKEPVPLAVIFNRSRIEKEESLVKSCPHCKLTYKHWSSYDDHIENCAVQKRLEKEKLDKEGPKPVQKEVDDNKLIKCIICLKKFMGSKNLREHMQVHQPKKGPPFECKTCHETFSDKGGLICHNALKHRSSVTEPIMKSERKKLHCIDCDENFQNSGDYICHQVLYHKKK